MKVLILLVNNIHSVVSRDQLIEEIWDNEFVGDDALTQAISKLRKVLESETKNPQIIETIPKTGYRFIGTIKKQNNESKTVSNQSINLSIIIYAILFVCVITVLFILNRNKKKITLIEPVQFTSSAGRENHPALSPKGDFVIFSKRNLTDTKMNLYLRALNTNEIRRITNSFSDDFCTIWTNDSKYIAYLRLINGKAEIRILPINNTNLDNPGQLITTLQFTNQTSIRWSPDYKSIIYRDKKSAEDKYQLYTINIETNETKIITDNFSRNYDYLNAIYSLNGDKLIYIKRLNNFDKLVMVNLNKPENETKILDFEGTITDLEWINDSTLLLSGNSSGQSSLWTCTIDGKLNWLRGERISHFSISRPAKIIIYSEMDYNIDLLSYNLTSKSPSQTQYSSTKTEWTPSISSDNSAVVFDSDRNGKSQLWIADLKSTLVNQLTFYANEIPKRPKWSPINNQIAFELLEDEIHSLYLIDANGGKANILLKDGFDNKKISWSPDGENIYYQSNKSGQKEIWSIKIDSRETKQITKLGGFYGEISADLKYLFYVKSDGSPGLWRKDINSDKKDVKVHDLPYLFNGDKWKLSKTGFYFKNPFNQNYQLSISHYDFLEKKTKNIVQFQSGIINSAITFDVSKDESSLFYTSLVKLESDLILARLTED